MASETDNILIIGVLVFGLICDFVAWIFTFSPIAIVWNIIYLIFLIIGFIGFLMDAEYLLIAPLIGFILDILIAVGGVCIILSGQDIDLITGNSLGRKLYTSNTDNEAIMMEEKRKGAVILTFLFMFYIITQPIAAGLIIYVVVWEWMQATLC